jgi:hypothetical protein
VKSRLAARRKLCEGFRAFEKWKSERKNHKILFFG